MAWPQNPRPAKSLLILKQQIDDAAPARDRSSDGTIASAQHTATNPDSDHEAHVTDSKGLKVVTAIDITHDPAHGVDCNKIAKALIDSDDERIKYIIWNRKIWNPDIDTASEMKRPAKNHEHHLHLSVRAKESLFDSTKSWQVGPMMPTGEAFNDPKPKLQRGSTGASVRMLQQMLGISADGNFWSETEAAVKDFQRTHDLVVDGIVGRYTWDKLLADKPPAPLPRFDTNAVIGIVSASPVMRFNWPGRGVAPPGYSKGMACSFANAVLKLKANHPAAREMAKACAGDTTRDALAVYDRQFRNFGMVNGVSGIDTLRHLFVLMYGLGMRESSGRYCEGRDRSASNTSAESAEAGLFQMSWDGRAGSTYIESLLDEYRKDPSDGYFSVFKEGVYCKASDMENYGDGKGFEFQRVCKLKPDFAVEAAAVGLRNIRKHWGPINRGEVTIVPQVDTMLKAVQDKLP